MTHKLSKYAKARIRELYSEKRLEVGQIADLYGVNRWTVHYTCRDLVHTHPAKVTDELIAELKQMHEDGVKGKEAARKLGVSPKTVYRHW